MNQEMQRVLLEISTFHAAEPAAVFRRIVQLLAEQYPGTMAMINLVDGDRIGYREAENPHPMFQGCTSIPLRASYCQFTTDSCRPLLIQDAARDPRFARHPAVQLGLTRYLAVPICDPAGTALGTLCILDDHVLEPLAEQDIQFLSLLAMRVSAELERERTTARRITAERETGEQLAELNRQLLATAEARKRFVAAVIHDLRQPIAAARTLAYLLGAETDPGERDTCQAMLENRLLTLGSMVDELMEFAESEDQGRRLQWEDVELEPLLSRCLEEFLPQAPRLHLEVPAHLPPVRTDAQKLRRIVRNLLSNAVKFTASIDPEDAAPPPEVSAAVRVGVRSFAEHWTLEVDDNGIGMTDEVRRSIFDDYYRAPGSEVEEARSLFPQGRGLGLGIVRRLCLELGAEITVQSAPGQGSCFTVRFPRLPAPR